MGARMAILDSEGFVPGQETQSVNVTTPPSPNVAIPGPYMIFVLVDGTPSVGTWVNVTASSSTDPGFDTRDFQASANSTARPHRNVGSVSETGVRDISLAIVVAVVVGVASLV